MFGGIVGGDLTIPQSGRYAIEFVVDCVGGMMEWSSID
jgi:hypothetical protein